LSNVEYENLQTTFVKRYVQISSEIIIIAIFYMHMKHQNEKEHKQRLQNIGLQQMFKVPVFGPNTRPQPSTPLVNRIINDHLLHATPRFSTGAARFTQLLPGNNLMFPNFFNKFFKLTF